ncbi:MAG: MmcQ/YjbR family DNA-binding protein [Bacteroidetes bacterium]|nr:MmcQ/YjbR family DNA-binding protein [Bacteroidota bacterium]
MAKSTNSFSNPHWTTIQNLMTELNFPSTEESTSYGTPSFKVKTKFLCRLKEDGETLVIHSDDRDEWLADDPNIFFVTDHYRNYPYVLVHLKKIGKKKLKQLLTKSWKEIAPERLLKQWE